MIGISDTIIELNGEWKCNLCEKIFNNRYNALRHSKSKRKCDERVLYKCEKCEKEFNDKTKFARHSTTSCENRRKTSETAIQVDLLKDRTEMEDVFKVFLPNYLYNFVKFIYNKINIDEIDCIEYQLGLKTKCNLLVENCLKYVSQLNDNDLHEFYSLLLKKYKFLDMDRIYLFYSIVKKNMEIMGKNEKILIWNERLFAEMIKDISKKNEQLIEFS